MRKSKKESKKLFPEVTVINGKENMTFKYIPTVINVYETIDGEVFHSESEAVKHEEHIEFLSSFEEINLIEYGFDNHILYKFTSEDQLLKVEKFKYGIEKWKEQKDNFSSDFPMWLVVESVFNYEECYLETINYKNAAIINERILNLEKLKEKIKGV